MSRIRNLVAGSLGALAVAAAHAQGRRPPSSRSSRPPSRRSGAASSRPRASSRSEGRLASAVRHRHLTPRRRRCYHGVTVTGPCDVRNDNAQVARAAQGADRAARRSCGKDGARLDDRRAGGSGGSSRDAGGVHRRSRSVGSGGGRRRAAVRRRGRARVLRRACGREDRAAPEAGAARSQTYALARGAPAVGRRHVQRAGPGRSRSTV